jgi:aminoglycoside phosphotransferase (APT) family kinase protein
MTTYLSTEWEARSVVHADYRIDNLLFFPDPTRRPVVVDWGGIAVGPPVADISYLLGASLPAEDRRAAEQQLVRGYHAGLLERGVDAMGWEECWHQYRVHAVSGMVMAIFAPLIVQRTDRGDELFITMAERHAEQIRDLGVVDLLG